MLKFPDFQEMTIPDPLYDETSMCRFPRILMGLIPCTAAAALSKNSVEASLAGAQA
mgnify:CR=1 FL=1